MISNLFPTSGITETIVAFVLAHNLFQILCHGQNLTHLRNGQNISSSSSGIDFDALSLYGISHEFAEEFKENIIKAIEEPYRQGEFGGVSGGFYQNNQGGSSGPQSGSISNQEYYYEYEDVSTTQGPGIFGILSGLFGVASGLGTRNPTQVLQSAVNFFPPSRRMQAQMFVDSLVMYIPQENRTSRPRPRTPRPGPSMMTINELMMKAVTEGQSKPAASPSTTGTGALTPKGVEENEVNATVLASSSRPNGTITAVNSVTPSEPDFVDIEDPIQISTTPDFIDTLEKFLENSTILNSLLSINEADGEKKENEKIENENESEVDTRGVVEEEIKMKPINKITWFSSTSPTKN